MKIDINFGRNYARLNLGEVVIICHGLPFESGSAIDKSYDSIAEYFSRKGLPSLVFDFSGTGKSKGNFSLFSWIEDLENIVSNFERFHLIGFSMGGAVAYNVDGAESYSIVSSPFSPEIFDERVLEQIYSNALLKGTLRGIGNIETFKKKFVEEFSSIAPVNSAPKKNVLVVHGLKDDVVPFEHGEKLFRHSKKPKKFVRVINGGHFLRKNEKIYKVAFNWIAGKNGNEVEDLVL